MCFEWQWGKRLELLQPVVRLSLAALPGPGATLVAELPQVLPEVLVVHGPVGLRLTLRLRGKPRRGGKKHVNRTRHWTKKVLL